MLPPLCFVLGPLCSLACSTVIWSPIAPFIEAGVHWPWLNWPNSLTEDSILQGCSQATDHSENHRFPVDFHSANRPAFILLQKQVHFLKLFVN